MILEHTCKGPWITIGLKSEAKISFTFQVDNKTEEYNLLRIEFEEKRAECLKLQTEYQELEERFFKSGLKSKEEVGRELRVRKLLFITK